MFQNRCIAEVFWFSVIFHKFYNIVFSTKVSFIRTTLLVR